jgi:hypothetical protein
MKGKGTLISDLDAVVLRANSSPRWLDLLAPMHKPYFAACWYWRLGIKRRKKIGIGSSL